MTDEQKRIEALEARMAILEQALRSTHPPHPLLPRMKPQHLWTAEESRRVADAQRDGSGAVAWPAA